MEYQLAFGRLIVGRWDGRMRRDVYINREGERFAEPCFALDGADKSNVHDATIGNGYDPKCSSCWLGYAHSEAYHRRNVGG